MSASASPSPTPLTASSDLADRKRLIRSHLRAQRARVPSQIRAAHDGRLQQVVLDELQGLGARSVMAFSPLLGEPGGRNLPEVLASSGLQVFIPRIVPLPDAAARGLSGTAAKTLEFADAQHGSAPGTWGIFEPVGPAVDNVLSCVDVCIVPALAVDHSGKRLGQGGGFYDRTLGQVTNSHEVWALVDHTEFVPCVPSDQLDLIVSAVVTDQGFTRIERR